MGTMTDSPRISVLLADDNVLVREGVRALLSVESDFEVVGVAIDYDSLIAGADEHVPQVVVTDIRMPPDFQNEGIEAAKEIRKRHPGTGIVILSQYADPEYAIALLDEGAAGYAYLLKDRVSDGNRLARAIREVATGGSMLDPEIVEALVSPVRDESDLTSDEQALLHQVAEGRPVKAIAASLETTPEAVNAAIESLFLTLARGASAGQESALRRLRLLQKAIVDREEQGETLSRLLPGGLAERLRHDRDAIEQTELLTVTVLMSDVRGYSGIAERTDPANARRSAQRTPPGDERGDPRRRGHGHAVRRRCGDGRLRCAVPPDRTTPIAHCERPSDAPPPARRERAVGNRWSGIVPPRDRSLHRRGRRRGARQRGAHRVHGGRRHREPGPATPGSRPAGGHDRRRRRHVRARCPNGRTANNYHPNR